MRKHSRKPAVTITRVDADRWVPEPSLSGPRHCPEYAVWSLRPSRAADKKTPVSR